MMKCIHAAKTIVALLIVFVAVAMGAAASPPARADTGKLQIGTAGKTRTK